MAVHWKVTYAPNPTHENSQTDCTPGAEFEDSVPDDQATSVHVTASVVVSSPDVKSNRIHSWVVVP
eukprot:7389747-Prymnesium_polylepis.1